MRCLVDLYEVNFQIVKGFGRAMAVWSNGSEGSETFDLSVKVMGGRSECSPQPQQSRTPVPPRIPNPNYLDFLLAYVDLLNLDLLVEVDLLDFYLLAFDLLGCLIS